MLCKGSKGLRITERTLYGSRRRGLHVREEGYGDIVARILCGERCVEYTKGITQRF